MRHLSEKVLSARGDRTSMVMRHANGNTKMMAVVWMDRYLRYFIATASSTREGDPYSPTRWRQITEGPARVELNVPQPHVAEIYFLVCAMIDRHNRCRQYDLMLERKVGTQDWSFHVNCSLLGVIVVDAWLLYSGGRGSRASMEQRSFLREAGRPAY
jgi:hypothetical protein